jgi:hypothetical protein
MSEQWYWCLVHRRVESAHACKADSRMGPYASPEAARDWKARLEQREDAWEEEDERWHGRDDDRS